MASKCQKHKIAQCQCFPLSAYLWDWICSSTRLIASWKTSWKTLCTTSYAKVSFDSLFVQYMMLCVYTVIPRGRLVSKWVHFKVSVWAVRSFGCRTLSTLLGFLSFCGQACSLAYFNNITSGSLCWVMSLWHQHLSDCSSVLTVMKSHHRQQYSVTRNTNSPTFRLRKYSHSINTTMWSIETSVRDAGRFPFVFPLISLMSRRNNWDVKKISSLHYFLILIFSCEDTHKESST